MTTKLKCVGTTDEGAAVMIGEPQTPRWWHLAWCLGCTDGRTGEAPFLTQEARAEWMDAHQEGTGHTDWRTLSIRANPTYDAR